MFTCECRFSACGAGTLHRSPPRTPSRRNGINHTQPSTSMKIKPPLVLALLLAGVLSYYYPWLPLLLVKCLREWLLTPKANFRPVRLGLP